MAWFFGWGCVMDVSCHKRCDRIKIPSCSKAVSAKHYRSIFYNRSYATLTSLYKWKILEQEEKKTTTNQSSLNKLYCICFQRKILLDSKCICDLWTLWLAQVLWQSKFCFSLVDYILLMSWVLWSMNLLFFSIDRQSPNRTIITMETPNGTILWNANFNISAEHPEQMPFNAYSPEASVKVHIALTNEFICVMCVRQVCFKIVETKSGKL